MERVRNTHEVGGEGLPDQYNSQSTGWRYDWSEEESRKNLLRTHTTAASSRALYQIAELAKQQGGQFKPQKYFSIDRVFRNEALDATHLAEFHQASASTPKTPSIRTQGPQMSHRNIP
jgi:phenylalanyl-tRNA synthetase alpha chain